MNATMKIAKAWDALARRLAFQCADEINAARRARHRKKLAQKAGDADMAIAHSRIVAECRKHAEIKAQRYLKAWSRARDAWMRYASESLERDFPGDDDDVIPY